MSEQAVEIPRPVTQVCFVSEQPTPNVVPLLDSRLRPQRVVLLVTDAMRDRAEWMTNVLKQRGLSVTTVRVADPWQIQASAAAIRNTLTPIADEGQLVVNLTGGTKTMTIAAQMAASERRWPQFYVRHDTGEALWIDAARPTVRLDASVGLREYLMLHGYELISGEDVGGRAPAAPALTRELIKEATSFATSLGYLNSLAYRAAQQGGLSTDMERSTVGHDALLRQFEEAGLLSVNGTRLQFASEAARTYCNGGWLEEHVAGELHALRGELELDELMCNVKVRSLDNREKGNAGSNEIDVAFMRRNRLYLIECKTMRLDASGAAAPALYKLDSLHRLGGRTTACLFASYRKLEPGEWQRARDLGVEAVVGTQLRDLRGHLQKWVMG